ncbi:unnamed protein product (mitochondrion) [Plasmodiophora brassicae]|uniref:Uncharacterized protein n=1 Tax=Plasmodiophora brassicae TaxID=37360 RepID=A0A3P3Y8C0_PLABS|nr:unnamed protein product [Plasmodiophora brassicae]
MPHRGTRDIPDHPVDVTATPVLTLEALSRQALRAPISRTPAQECRMISHSRFCLHTVPAAVATSESLTTGAGTLDDTFATLVADGHPAFSILELESGLNNRWVTRSLEPGLYLLFAGRRLPPRP